MNWILLVIADFLKLDLHLVWVKQKKQAELSQRIGWAVFYLSFHQYDFIIKATQELPIGTAYAVWTGIGAVGTVLVGIFIFKEPATFWRIFFLSTLIASIIGLKFVSSH
jgi:quaternary ammonium compound-resistance protein SugE